MEYRLEIEVPLEDEEAARQLVDSYDLETMLADLQLALEQDLGSEDLVGITLRDEQGNWVAGV